MYAVELMLGETDETHIIRTIEYWDNEKRRYPQRQHYAVLVAESVSRRFFNVIHILSLNVPIIAIQASLVAVDEHRGLLSTKILDTYEEPDVPVEAAGEEASLDYWNRKAQWTADTAAALHAVAAPEFSQPELRYTKTYVSITVGRNNYFFLHNRSGNKSLLGFRMAAHLYDEAQRLLDEAKLSFTKKGKNLYMTVDQATVQANAQTLAKIAGLVAKTWSKSE